MLFRSAAMSVVDQSSAALDAGLRTAFAVHELLALYGMKYWADSKSSYQIITKKETKKTEIDDLAILWSALLEASSVETAFVTVPGHIFIAFALTMKPAEAKDSLRAADLIEKAGKAWETGAREWKESEAKGQAGFFPFADARAKYAPVGFSAATSSYSLPADSALATAYKSELKKLVDRETATQVAALKAEMKKDSANPEPVNRLGVLYAKYGDWDRAAAEFARAVKISDTYVPAFVNAGNIAFLKGEPAKAPDKTTVLLGIAGAVHLPRPAGHGGDPGRRHRRGEGNGGLGREVAHSPRAKPMDSRGERSYTTGMKTAVSLPDRVFQEAERFARRLRKSRSQLYAEAIAEYLARHAPDDVTESMNVVCDRLGQVDNEFTATAARRLLRKESW